MPQRIQMSRQHPWRAEHPDAVIVARPSRWGNPYRVRRDLLGMWAVVYVDASVGPFDEPREACLSLWANRSDATAEAVRLHRARLIDVIPETRFPVDPWMQRDIAEQLAGKDLACWCPLDQPCHADVLLEIASGGDPR